MAFLGLLSTLQEEPQRSTVTVTWPGQETVKGSPVQICPVIPHWLPGPHQRQLITLPLPRLELI